MQFERKMRYSEAEHGLRAIGPRLTSSKLVARHRRSEGVERSSTLSMSSSQVYLKVSVPLGGVPVHPCDDA